MLEPVFQPFPEISTRRLLLRKIIPADTHTFYALRTNENVMRYIDKDPPKNLEETAATLDRIEKDLETNNGITWAVCLQSNTADLIGTVGFWQLMKAHYRAEIGYMLHPDFWRQGLMEEAVAAAIDYGFNKMKLHSIQANINPGNSASGGLLEKLGFVREAYFKEDYYFRGRFLDSAIYSLLEK